MALVIAGALMKSSRYEHRHRSGGEVTA